MTTRDFIYKALSGTTKKDMCSSVFSVKRYPDEPAIVYSYGYHYPLATIINGKGFVNNRGYSVTTAKHINWAFDAVSSIVGYNNTYGVPLTDGNGLTLSEIKSSAKREYDRLKLLMDSKKRKDTAVYADLERQADKMADVLEVLEVL